MSIVQDNTASPKPAVIFSRELVKDVRLTCATFSGQKPEVRARKILFIYFQKKLEKTHYDANISSPWDR